MTRSSTGSGAACLRQSALNINLEPSDVAARGNLCTVDASGVVTDRRAGRYTHRDQQGTVQAVELAGLKMLNFWSDCQGTPAGDCHAWSRVGISVSGSDPLKNGYLPHPICAHNPESEKTVRLVNRFVERGRKLLEEYRPKQAANMILVRGFDSYPDIPAFPKMFGLASGRHCAKSHLPRDSQIGWHAGAAGGGRVLWQMNSQPGKELGTNLISSICMSKIPILLAKMVTFPAR